MLLEQCRAVSGRLWPMSAQHCSARLGLVWLGSDWLGSGFARIGSATLQKESNVGLIEMVAKSNFIFLNRIAILFFWKIEHGNLTLKKGY